MRSGLDNQDLLIDSVGVDLSSVIITNVIKNKECHGNYPASGGSCP